MLGNKTCSFTPSSIPTTLEGVGAVPAAQEKKPHCGKVSPPANRRQTPQRVVEIAWKRLKRDPNSVVSLAFHCGWQIQDGTLLMKTLKKHWMLMKTNNLIPRCSWHRLWHDGRRKVLVIRPTKLNWAASLLARRKKSNYNLKCSKPISNNPVIYSEIKSETRGEVSSEQTASEKMLFFFYSFSLYYECEGRAALENMIQFSGYHELLMTFQ